MSENAVDQAVSIIYLLIIIKLLLLHHFYIKIAVTIIVNAVASLFLLINNIKYIDNYENHDNIDIILLIKNIK